jgi:glucose/arabinose dehydrogenase
MDGGFFCGCTCGEIDSPGKDPEWELDTRIRDVRTGPDGNIYALTDKDNGQALRLSPR